VLVLRSGIVWAALAALAAAGPAPRNRLRLAVKPSPAIESRVREETEKAERILNRLDAGNALSKRLALAFEALIGSGEQQREFSARMREGAQSQRVISLFVSDHQKETISDD